MSPREAARALLDKLQVTEANARPVAGLPVFHPDITAARGRFVQAVIEGERVAAATGERLRQHPIRKGASRAI